MADGATTANSATPASVQSTAVGTVSTATAITRSCGAVWGARNAVLEGDSTVIRIGLDIDSLQSQLHILHQIDVI